MSTSLTLYVQVSCFFMINVASQYPTMYAMPGFSQDIIPFQNQIQNFQNSDPTFRSKLRHKSKRNNRKKKGFRRTNKYSSESSSRSSESEDSSDEECGCDLTCDQCSNYQPYCCHEFCNSCMQGQNINHGVILVPYPYPVLLTNDQSSMLQPDTPEKDDASDKEDNDKPTEKPKDTVSEKPKEEKDGQAVNKITTKTEKSKENNDKPIKNQPKESPEALPVDIKNKTNTAQKTIIDHTTKTTTQNILNSRIIKKKIIKRTLKKKLKPNKQQQRNNKSSGNEMDANSIKVLLDAQNNDNDLKDIIFKVPNNGNTKYVLTSMRRVKENWLPKYGIVPIPENVATNLMTNLRSLKTLQPVRDTDSMTAKETPKSAIKTIAVRSSELESADHETPRPPPKLQTILLRDTRSGLTIEGPRSAVQSFNRRFLESMQRMRTENKLQKLEDSKKADALPIELVKKIYQY